MPTNVITGPLRYTVNGGIAQPGLVAPGVRPRPMRAWVRQHFLALPNDLDPRVVALAQQWAADAPDNLAKAESLRGFLLNNFVYDLTQSNADKPDPLVSFLLEDRRGHCEYFATAFAVLLRAVGVPSRVVGGYQGGSWDDDGGVVVFTGQNAHAWVEWFDPATGWRVDDATPEVSAAPQRLTGFLALTERLRRAWDDYIVDYGIEEQIALMKAMANAVRPKAGATADGGRSTRALVRWGLTAVLAGALALFGTGAWRWLRRRRRGRAHPLGQALLLALERLRGEPVPAARTLREAVAATAGPPTARPDASRDAHEAAVAAVLWQALQMYEAERFGERPPPVDERAVIAALAKLSHRGQSHGRAGTWPA
jgi:hypothetical protein